MPRPGRFAASFDKYAAYNAQVGAPGAVDAGAGQRFVPVPVQINAKLKTGALVSMTGSVTLHRTVVDGASQEQKSWRIRTADIRPRPAPAATPLPPLDNRSTARYKCIDGSRLTAAFDPDNARVTITRAGKPLVLKQERVVSGIRYVGGGVSFAGKGESMTFSRPGLPPLPCSPIRR
jgi:membrane-bound inhibitor of C-type lysozyme